MRCLAVHAADLRLWFDFLKQRFKCENASLRKLQIFLRKIAFMTHKDLFNFCYPLIVVNLSICESWFLIHQDVYHDLFVCS